ncbi:hypothetical protein EYF80_042153 [Liparis tanakae]|uniref:Uncharacterized protein n=1 Tax=Liparis tanakae TaxID=230148 RepID=A0A4Z2G464_9TELE|nr:hypothetical protein EYF80_042153 [Liparis tanakae]
MDALFGLGQSQQTDESQQEDTRVHEHAQTHFLPVSALVSPDAPASGVSSVSHKFDGDLRRRSWRPAAAGTRGVKVAAAKTSHRVT